MVAQVGRRGAPACDLFLLLLFFFSGFSDAYDPMDPNGNITINWDFVSSSGKTHTVTVSVYNYQLYRHIESPGWRLGWSWPNDDAISSMLGAESTNQGNCSRFQGDSLPHCCERSPTIVDLPLGSPYSMQTSKCCRGGVLSSLTQDSSRSLSTFKMVILDSSANISDPDTGKPYNFSIGVPGYTCSNVSVVAPSKFRFDEQRTTQALMTWEVTCSYSQFRESVNPGCCVSLSAFYNETIVSCPRCSCGCQGSPASSQCLSSNGGGERSDWLRTLGNDGGEQSNPVVLCTRHMCPIGVHWHVKVSYKEYWRVKVTVTNYNMIRNYSDWNLVIQHPNLRSITQIFSFNYKPLIYYGDINDTGMFWGIEYYNDMLLQQGENGNVQSEILLHKDKEEFTFGGGWPFPRSIAFDGRECVMPAPDLYPTLPNRSSPARLSLSRALLLLPLLCYFSL